VYPRNLGRRGIVLSKSVKGIECLGNQFVEYSPTFQPCLIFVNSILDILLI
jgi:hypothetical protein